MRPWLAIVLVVAGLGTAGALLGVRYVAAEMSKPLDHPPPRPLSPRFGNGPVGT